MASEPDSVLRHRPFVLFWFARLSVTASYQMLIVAVAWQLYALTGDPFDLGLIGLIQFVPAMLLFLVVGQVTDRYDRRLLLIGCQLIEAVAAATLLTAVLTGAISRELILGTCLHPRHRARLRGDGDADHRAEPGAAAAGAARGRGVGDRQSKRHHRGAGARRLALHRGPVGGVRRLRRAVRRRRAAHRDDPHRAHGAVARAAHA